MHGMATIAFNHRSLQKLRNMPKIHVQEHAAILAILVQEHAAIPDMAVEPFNDSCLTKT